MARSLNGTTVPTNTALYQLNCVFVFLLSVCLLGEGFTVPKTSAVLICFTGTALVVYSGGENRCVCVGIRVLHVRDERCEPSSNH